MLQVQVQQKKIHNLKQYGCATIFTVLYVNNFYSQVYLSNYLYNRF